METSPDTSTATLDSAELALTIESAAAEKADTIGNYSTTIHDKASALMKADGIFREVGEELESHSKDIAKAADGSTDINVDAGLEPGLNGYTVIGGSESDITVNADLLFDSDALAETIDHEKRHNEQVEPVHANGEALLITASGQEMENITQVVEGDTETHTAKMHGPRTGKPKDYEQGFKVAAEIQRDHAEAWDRTLTRTGDLRKLQKEIWLKQLEEGKLDVPTLIQQAERTGYEEEAAEVLSLYLKQGAKVMAA